MSKRAERTTTCKVLENYENSFWFSFTGTFRVPYHLSVSKRIRDNVPRLLTSLQTMWLLDLREPPESHRNREGEDEVKKLSSRPRAVHKPQTIRSSNGKTRRFVRTRPNRQVNAQLLCKMCHAGPTCPDE
ncbi:MAG TPA: hypothetical protein VEL71_09280 [Candidatus Dormibacteraeota bacterium]|nr:hypothetical protein [Candidatus Dormibacteraeota bacterium]